MDRAVLGFKTKSGRLAIKIKINIFNGYTNINFD